MHAVIFVSGMVVVFHGKLELSQILRVINTYSSKPFLTPNYSGSSSGRGGNISDLLGLKFMALGIMHK